jgi:hypothetical protein
MKRVYICHPYAGDPEASQEKCRALCKAIIDSEDSLPISPQIYLHQFMDEKDRFRCMDACLELLSMCDEVRVFGVYISPGMKVEIARANTLEITVRYEDIHPESAEG